MRGVGHYARVVEAALLIVLARLLVAFVPFRLWRRSLGAIKPSGPKSAESGLAADGLEFTREPAPLALACAHAVARAAFRMPAALCLPRAMALQWMLARRHLPGELVMGVQPGHATSVAKRRALGDLHAWVAMGGCVLLNDSSGVHHEVLRLRL